MTGLDQFSWFISILNFAVLYVLFNAVVIQPMIKVAREREQNAKDKIAEAETLYQEAVRHRDQYQAMLGKVEEERKVIAEHAADEADRIRQGRNQEAEREARFIADKAAHEAVMLKRQAAAELQGLAAERSVTRARHLLDTNLDAEGRQQILATCVEKVS